MGNPYYRISASGLVVYTSNAATVLGGSGGTSYGLPAPVITELPIMVAALQDALEAVEAAKAAQHAAVAAKKAADKTLRDYFAMIAGKCYSNPAVTDVMLEAIGLEPRVISRTKRLPYTPTVLTSRTTNDGAVTLSWNRNGNTTGTIFQIQQLIDGQWQIVKSVTGSKTTLAPYELGVPVSFRVLATRNDVVSLPSQAVTIYDPGQPQVELQVA